MLPELQNMIARRSPVEIRREAEAWRQTARDRALRLEWFGAASAYDCAACCFDLANDRQEAKNMGEAKALCRVLHEQDMSNGR